MFSLRDKKQIRYRFAIASDGHYGEPGVPSDTNYRDLVSWIKNEKISRGLDIWFFNGDLIHENPVHMDTVKEYLDQTGTDYYPVKGNHDLISSNAWEAHFNLSENFAFAMNDMAFIASVTSDSAGNYLCADTEWLSDSLNKYYHFTYIFVFLHISQGGWTLHGIHCPEVIDLLDKFPGITAVFHGHDHQEDHVKKSLNTKYFFDGYIGGSWGGDYYGYRIVEIYHDGAALTYQYNPKSGRIINKDDIYKSKI